MSNTRLSVPSAIALIVAMTFNCGVAVAEPNQTSADYLMPGCRDAASLVTFSNIGESEEQASLMGFCAGIVVGLSIMGQPYGTGLALIAFCDAWFSGSGFNGVQFIGAR